MIGSANYFFRILRIFAIHAALLYFRLPPDLRFLLPDAAARFFFVPLRRFFVPLLRVEREPVARPARANCDCVATVCWPMPEIPARPRRGICGIRIFLQVDQVG